MQSLQAKRVLITAPRQYASKLCSTLINSGARPIWLPSIQITSLPKSELHTIDATLKELERFSHVAFTSKNGIAAVMERFHVMFSSQQQIIEYVDQCHVKLCALGADAEELLKHGLQAHIRPKEASTTGLVKELRDRNELHASTVLCPIPSVRGGLTEPVIVPRFLQMLRDEGANVVPLSVYVTEVGCSPKDCIVEKELLQQGLIDAIVFTSSAEAQGFVHAIGSLEEVRSLCSKNSIALTAHGPYTAAGVASYLDLEIPFVSQNFKTFDGIVDALENAFV